MQNVELLSKTVAANLVALRKSRGLTQQELSEKLRYSDKSVSKWERGASLPRVEIMKELAEFYGVSVDYLLSPHSETEAQALSRDLRRKANWGITAAMLFCFVWSIAAIIYGALTMQGNGIAWVSFVYAVPVSLLPLLLMLNKYMGHQNAAFLAIASLLLWTALLSFYLNFLDLNLWYIFVAGIPLQVIIFLYTKFH